MTTDINALLSDEKLMNETRSILAKGNTEAINLEEADFSDALMWLKEGKRIARKGWNGKGQYCYMVPEYYAPECAKTYGAYFVLKNAQNIIVPWVPSVGDLLATDWVVVS